MYTLGYSGQKKLTTTKGSMGAKRKLSQQMIQRIPRNVPFNKPNLNEVKYCDVAFSDDNFFVPPVNGVLLNGIVQGAAQFNRIGNKIAMKSLRVRGQIINLLTNVQTYARIVIVYDKQCNGSIPTSSVVLQTRDSAGASANTAFSELNMDFMERFTILRDYSVMLPSVTNTAGVLTNIGFDPGQNSSGGSIFEVDLFIKLKGLITLYKGATAGIADIATGGLYMYCISHQNSNTWAFRNTERLRYYDN